MITPEQYQTISTFQQQTADCETMVFRSRLRQALSHVLNAERVHEQDLQSVEDLLPGTLAILAEAAGSSEARFREQLGEGLVLPAVLRQSLESLREVC